MPLGIRELNIFINNFQNILMEKFPCSGYSMINIFAQGIVECAETKGFMLE